MPGYGRAFKAAKRLYPLAKEAWRRWDQLSDAEKERYKQQAKKYANQAYTLARDATERTIASRKQQRGGRKRGR
jgi:hypothetical protein